MKYIIKNCPAYVKNGYRHSCGCRETTEYYCIDNSDCLLKQIVKICREEMRFSRKSDLALATDIMSFLEIEEVNE